MLGKIIKNLSFQEWVAWNIRNPAFPIIFTLVFTAFFAWHIPKLSFNTSVYDLEIEDLEETKRYHDFKALFGSDEIIRVVIKADDVFSPDTFSKISRLSDELSKVEGVRRVIGLPGIKAAIDMSGNWGVEKFYAIISHVDLFKRNLLSEDRKTTALTLVLSTDAQPGTVIQAVDKLILDSAKNLSLYQIGMPLFSEALVRYTEKDFFRLPPITFLLIAVMLFFLFRKLQYLCIPLASVAIALVWMFGLMALAGIPMSMLTMIVPVFLIAVGTAYCFHIVTEYLSCIQESQTSREAAMATFSTVSFPLVLAVLTTMVGLGSLLVNRIPSVREFAIFSCFGMLSLLFVSLITLPAVIGLIPLPKGDRHQRIGAMKVFDGFIQKIVQLNLNHRKIVLPLLGGLVAFCSIGILRIQVETNPVDYFKGNTPVRQHFQDIYQDLSGCFPINVVMNGGRSDYFDDPRKLADIVRLQDFLATLPGIDKTISFADYMKLVNYALNGFDPKYYSLPEEGFEMRMVLNNYTTMLGEEMYARFMAQDLSATNVVLLTHITGSRDFLNTRDRIMAFVADSFPKDISWDVTGFSMAISASSQRITTGQVNSLALTLVLVFFIMFTLFLSWKVGLIAIVVNLFPIIINFGIMGWLGVELSMVTSLIASIAIGLAVDDTIHYLFRYNREFKKDLDSKRALGETLKQVGRPIVFTTVTICVGFSILMFSNFKPTAVFGIMMAITMLSALVGDLILLPSLMQHVELVTLWDLVRLKLGQEPAKGIPLFGGLSRTEVHYLIMAGTLKKIEAGEVLFRKGDSSNSMYTIISGTLDVLDSPNQECSLSDQPSARLINRMKAGDVLGEMGLLRSAPRSATVVACEPVELLPINWTMIKRLQWLYPPTARKFMHNLLKILCGRVERLTTCLAEVKVLDDATGLCNRENFLNLLEVEIQRSRVCHNDLSLCLMKVEPGNDGFEFDLWKKEKLMQSVSETLIRSVRRFDVLGRCGGQLIGLFFPQTPEAEAREICDRIQNLLQNKPDETDAPQLKISLGLTTVRADQKDTANGWIKKTIELIQ